MCQASRTNQIHRLYEGGSIFDHSGVSIQAHQQTSRTLQDLSRKINQSKTNRLHPSKYPGGPQNQTLHCRLQHTQLLTARRNIATAKFGGHNTAPLSVQPYFPTRTSKCSPIDLHSPAKWVKFWYKGNPAKPVMPTLLASCSYLNGRTPCAIVCSPR